MSKKDLDLTLENEIGALGGEETKSLALGKLQHKAAYGGKEDLNNDEQESLNKFLNKGKQLKEQEELINISDSWIPIDKEDLGIRAMFYPESWEFFIKPATMKAIKNWTAIDESRPDQVNKVFNEIIKQLIFRFYRTLV